MKKYATHRVTKSGLALVALLALAGCPADGGSIDLERAILVNDASDEVLGVIADAVDNGQVQIDDAKAAAIVSPAPGTTVPRDPPAQFAWALPNAVRHGTQTGDYLWMRMSGGGLARDIDMVAVDVTNWTPTADEWAEITTATGPITITLTYAFVMDGIIKDGGPYRGTSPTTFTISN